MILNNIKKLSNKLSTSEKGFSLVEVMVTIFIASIVIAGLYTILLMGEQSWDVNSVNIRLTQESRKAFDWMEYDLRQSGTSPSYIDVDTDGTWYTSIEFSVPEGVVGGGIVWVADTIRFSLNGEQLIRTEGANSKVVAQNISALKFRRFSANPHILEIEITVSDETARGDLIELEKDYKIQLRNN
jgi:prepilin-type N-terminal cleavage/methylation domain-containing protein